MHDPTLDKKPIDLKHPDNLDLQEKYIHETTLALAKHYNITEARAITALGYAMKWSDSYPSAKDVIVTLDFVSKKTIKTMTEEERQAMLAIGYLVRKLGPFKSETNKIGRNDPCPCGSTKKFKQCCLEVAKLNEVERYKNGNK